jgi:PKD repeat protein
MGKTLRSFPALIAPIIFILLLSGKLFSQTTVTLGTGNLNNTATTYPCPYGAYANGARHQILILASELQAFGLCGGPIQSIAFDVVSPHVLGNGNCTSNPPLTGFTIRMRQTTLTALSSFQTGLTTVFGPVNYMEVAGWNTHTFSTPFVWDGVSNLIIETCFQNNCWASNAIMRRSNTNFNSVVFFRGWNPGVCNSNQATSSNLRPNMRLTLNSNAFPPTTNFTVNTTFVCLGSPVSFTDLSGCGPSSWLWNFGDGNFSTQQNPTHTYTNPGVYTVTLTATNGAGSNTATQTGLITVGSGPYPPVACTVTTQNPNFGFGITNFSFQNINNTTGNSQQEGGYKDYSCARDTVLLGGAYNMSVTTPSPAPHNVRVWIDWNNDGVFNSTAELALQGNSTYLTSGLVYVPSNATLNTPLRIRVSANHDLYAAPSPCTNVEAGQIEDYAIVVIPNNQAPVANFFANPVVSCDGNVSFTDLSYNLPTSWLWDFGDLNTSFLQNPTHSYTNSGTYTVTLTVSNANGSNTQIQNNYITVILNALPIAPSCTPQTFSYCCQYGIYNVQFNTINHSTGSAAEGYQDFTCPQRTTVNALQSYPLTITTGTLNPQDTRVWIDWNNDGAFRASELVLSSNNSYNPTANVVVPGSAVAFTPLRMRVASDYSGSNPGSCTNMINGQVEDYTVIVNTTTPVSSSDDGNFNLYPNPVGDGAFFLEFSGETFPGNFYWSIFNISGSCLKNGNSGNMTTAISTEQMSPGIYFIRISADGFSPITKKLIIQ